MGELVSILVPAYNAESWVAETIQSALDQTLCKKEIIVVDDGSRDATLQIARRFESDTVKVVTQENRGACGARNAALSLSQGDYIQWLDADDLLHPQKIAMQLKGAAEGRESRTLLTCAWGRFFYRHQKAKFIPSSLWQDLEPADWIVKKFVDNVWMNPTVWLVSRRLTDLAGPWDERLSLSGDDDGEYICRLISRSERVKFVREARCYYRIGNNGSLDWKMGESVERLGSFLLSLRLTINHLLSLEDSERTRQACLKFLQSWFELFSVTGSDLRNEFNDLAYEVGGRLMRPQVNWKYYPIQKMCGHRLTIRIMSKWRKAKLMAQNRLDKIMYAMGGK